MSAGASMGFAQAKWRVTAFLALAVGLNYADRAALSSVLAVLRDDLHLSDTSLGLLGSAFLWSYAVCSLYAGSLPDRFSRSRMVIVSLLLWSFVTALTGAATGFFVLLALRICLGVAESMYLPSAIALLADHHPTSTRGFAMALHSVGLNFGVIAGGAFAGYIAEMLGWRSGFWFLGALGILVGFAGRRVLTDARPAGCGERRPTYATALRYLITVPSYYILLVKAMLAGVGVWIFFNWLPLYFRDTFGLSLGSAGLAGTFLIQVSGTVGIAVGGWVSDRVAARAPPHRMLFQALCYLAAAVCLIPFVAAPTFAIVSVSIVGFSFLRSLGAANENPTLCDVVPAPLRSTAVGIMNTCATGAGGMGVLVAGILKSYWGLSGSFAALSVLFLIAGSILILGYKVYMPRDVERARRYSNDEAVRT